MSIESLVRPCQPLRTPNQLDVLSEIPSSILDEEESTPVFVVDSWWKHCRKPLMRTQSESGSSLVLALVFLVVVGLMLSALATLTGNDLGNSVGFKGQRSVLYASDAATKVAMWGVRYTHSNPGPVAVACPGTSPALHINGEFIEDWCNTTRPGNSNTRVVTISACLTTASGSPQVCTNPTVQAVVTFNDVSSSGKALCSATDQSSCGTGMTIDSWVDRN